MSPKTQKWARAPGQEFENKMASLGRKKWQKPGLELKNKMVSLGFKKMAFQVGVEFSPFLAFDCFLGMLSGRKTSRHSQYFEVLKPPGLLRLGAPGLEFRNKVRRWV